MALLVAAVLPYSDHLLHIKAGGARVRRNNDEKIKSVCSELLTLHDERCMSSSRYRHRPVEVRPFGYIRQPIHHSQRPRKHPSQIIQLAEHN